VINADKKTATQYWKGELLAYDAKTACSLCVHYTHIHLFADTQSIIMPCHRHTFLTHILLNMHKHTE